MAGNRDLAPEEEECGVIDYWPSQRHNRVSADDKAVAIEGTAPRQDSDKRSILPLSSSKRLFDDLETQL